MRHRPLLLLALLCIPLAAQDQARAGLLTLLSGEADSLVLWRFRDATWDGAYWTSDAGRDRPHPELPHRGVARPWVRALVLAAHDSLYLADGETLAHSYVLEGLHAGAPRFRIDLHSDGAGVPCLFVIDHEQAVFEEGYAVLGLSPEGVETWTALLDGLWKGTAVRDSSPATSGRRAFLELPEALGERLDEGLTMDEKLTLIGTKIRPWALGEAFRANASSPVSPLLILGFEGDPGVAGRVLAQSDDDGAVLSGLRLGLGTPGSPFRALFYVDWTMTTDATPSWQAVWYGPFRPAPASSD